MSTALVFPIIGMLVSFVGFACRWRAYLARVTPPLHFAPTEWGWWHPPLPLVGEFATVEARKLEVLGRPLMFVGIVVLLAGMFWVRLSA